MMRHVFILTHVRALDEYRDDVKHIGVFATLADAERARTLLAGKEGFCDYPDGFHIDRCEIGKINWADGFFNWGEE